MDLQVCVLASGSSGNCTYVGSEQTAILIDAGLSLRDTEERLKQINVPLSRISGVCVTHEHTDHTSGLGVLYRRKEMPIYINAGTLEGIKPYIEKLGAIDNEAWRIFVTGSEFAIGDLTVEPFSVSHDAYEPVGFIVRHDKIKVAVVTDIGIVTALVRERLKECHAIVIESNHDERMLTESKRPWFLKQRIKGRHGHLSNSNAAAIIAEVASPKLQQVFLAHLSSECNKTETALRTTKNKLCAMGYSQVEVCCAFADKISACWSMCYE